MPLPRFKAPPLDRPLMDFPPDLQPMVDEGILTPARAFLLEIDQDQVGTPWMPGNLAAHQLVILHHWQPSPPQ